MVDSQSVEQQAGRVGKSKETQVRQERLLLVAAVVYLVALIAHLAIWSELAALKYLVVLLAVTLAALIPELASERRLRLRLFLICVPAIGAALVELAGDHERDTQTKALQSELKDTRGQLSSQLRELQLAKLRDRVREEEVRGREEMIQLDPRDAVQSIQNADKGFLAKAEWLDAQGSHDQAKTYRAAADFLRREIIPRYKTFLSNASNKSFAEMRSELGKLVDLMETKAALYRVAGFHNHIGVLAMGIGQSERALAHYYAGLVIDPDHLPIYESLGYATWAVQESAPGALKYASLGLAQAERLKGRASRSKEWTAQVDGMGARLRLQFAYFSALDTRNEKLSRKYAEDLVAASPKDPEYLDALGFVLVRFAKSDTELKRAASLFKTAFEAPDNKQEKLTRRLVERHQRELLDEIKQFEGG